MILNIVTGSHFSQKKILKKTNKFFNKTKYCSLISDKNWNYIIQINKKSIKIVTSSQFDVNDSNKIKEYIKTLFQNESVLIDTSEKIEWLSNIKDVNVTTLIENI